MFDIKIPETMPFGRQILLSATFGAALGICLGVGVTVVVLFFSYLKG